MSGEGENTASQEMNQRVSVEAPDAESLKMEALAGIGGISERPEEGEGETHAKPSAHADGQAAEGDEPKAGGDSDGNAGAGDPDNKPNEEGNPKAGDPPQDPEQPAEKQGWPEEEEVKLNPHLPAKVKADFDKLLRQKISWREKAEAAEKASAEYRGVVESMAQSAADTGLPAEHLPKFVDFAAKAIVAGDAQAMEKVGARLLELGWKPQGHGEAVNVDQAVKAALDHYAEHYDTEAAMAAAKAVKAEKSEGTPKDAAKEAERKQEQEAKAHSERVNLAVEGVKGLIESETKGMQPEEAKAFMKRVDALLLGSIDKDDPTSWKSAYSVAFRMVKANGTAKPVDARKPPIVVQGKKTPSAVPKHSPGSYDALRAEAMNGLKK